MVARRHKSNRELQTLDQVVAALGGRKVLMELTGRSTQAVSNWLTIDKKFPAWTVQIMQQRLADRGYRAPSKLWGVAEPSPRQ